jgi:threonylcarbamoyladenosine tRNA methylthiotransferase MtaB
MKFKIHTYGCKVNTYDSGLLQSRLQRDGFEAVEEQPRVHILNSCAVTKEATMEAVKTARRLKAKDPFALVVVTGCAAQVDTEEFVSAPGVDLVVANSHKGQIEELIRGYYNGSLRERVFKSNIFKKEDLEAGGGVELGHSRAFLKIQDGCNSFCTFCVIPFARGKSRSITIAEIVRRVNDLYQQGIREAVLTGVHIADYQDGQKQLEDLVEALLQNTEMPRFRLSSLEPGELSPRLLAMYAAEPRLCRHFHMSIQSANSKVLKEMKRQYTAEAVEESLLAIAEKVPGAFVGMDVIAGFPGETDDEFLDSIERLKRLPWTKLHVFPYSQRPGTFAARRADQLERTTVKLRASLLRRLSEERLEAQAKAQMGQVKRGLVLRNGSLIARDYWTLSQPSRAAIASVENTEVDVRVIGWSKGTELTVATLDLP